MGLKRSTRHAFIYVGLPPHAAPPSPQTASYHRIPSSLSAERDIIAATGRQRSRSNADILPEALRQGGLLCGGRGGRADGSRRPLPIIGGCPSLACGLVGTAPDVIPTAAGPVERVVVEQGQDLGPVLRRPRITRVRSNCRGRHDPHRAPPRSLILGAAHANMPGPARHVLRRRRGLRR